jgi:hypothetical protein
MLAGRLWPVIGRFVGGFAGRGGGAGLARWRGDEGRRAGLASVCAPGRCFRDVHSGSGRLRAGVALVPDDGYCLALGERRAGGERLVGLARAQALADLRDQFGLYPP